MHRRSLQTVSRALCWFIITACIVPEKPMMTVCIPFQPTQLQHARRWSKTRSAQLGKWPKCSQFSGRLYVCGCGYTVSTSVHTGSVSVCVHVCRVSVREVCMRYMLLLKWGHKVSSSSLIRVQWSFLTCSPVGVFPAERRVKMYWRLRAWRPLACCRAEYSLEADRHCRVVSTSLFSTLYSILFVSFLHHHLSPTIGLISLSFSLSLLLWLYCRAASKLCFWAS